MNTFNSDHQVTLFLAQYISLATASHFPGFNKTHLVVLEFLIN